MSRYIDLHCHWVSGVDDGARSPEEGRQILAGLESLGFETVLATPHMRPGMFDNTAAELRAAFDRACTEARLFVSTGASGARRAGAPFPAVALACEHYFDDVVQRRIDSGEGLPYPGGRAILLEFYGSEFSAGVLHALAALRRRGLTPVIAHPERYRALWRKPETLEAVLSTGAAALLDLGALAGKYGEAPRLAALDFLERGFYDAACSDAHRSTDLVEVRAGMEIVVERYGQEELEWLLGGGPRELLALGEARE